MIDVSTGIEALGERLCIHARHCEGSGNRPAFVLVHGLGVSGRYMVPLLERLGGVGSAWAPDLPGFGRSPPARAVLDVPRLAEVLAAWVARVGLTRPILVGNSMGCQIVAQLAATSPDAVAAVVLVGPTMDRSAGGRWAQIGRWLATATREPPGMWWIALGDYLRAGFRRTWRTFALAHAHRTSLLYPEVTAPALVIRGERDLAVTPAWAERVTALLPHGQLVVVQGAAHAAQYDRPDEVARAVMRFVARLDATGVGMDEGEPDREQRGCRDHAVNSTPTNTAGRR